jgi:hypothetical protein
VPEAPLRLRDEWARKRFDDRSVGRRYGGMFAGQRLRATLGVGDGEIEIRGVHDAEPVLARHPSLKSCDFAG